jgi:hypothetical protein
MRKPNEFSRVLQVAMMLALPVGLASCAPEDGDELDTPETTIPDTDADMGVEAQPMTIDIEGVDTDVEGEATISRAGESLMVSLTLENLSGEGPFQAHLLSGRCEDRENAMGENRPLTEPATTEPGTTPPATEPGTTPGATPGQTMPGAQGQVLATLEPIQVSGATTDEGQAGMSHSTVPVSGLQGQTQAFIEVQGQGTQTVACGNVDNLNQILMGTGAGTARPQGY